jgi:hypothetical protein
MRQFHLPSRFVYQRGPMQKGRAGLIDPFDEGKRKQMNLGESQNLSVNAHRVAGKRLWFATTSLHVSIY